MFNAALSAAALAAAARMPLLERLHRDGASDLVAFCEEHNLDPPSVVAVGRVLASCGIVDADAEGLTLRRGPLFDAAYADKGFFLWLEHGYGFLLHHLHELCRNDITRAATNASFACRDGNAIALAGRDYGARFVDPYVATVLGDQQLHAIADLGCGSAMRLRGLLAGGQCQRAVGIDINRNAIELATADRDAAGLSDRLSLVCDDVRRLTPRPQYTEVDLLLCFFMGHDLWPKAQCLAVFDRLRDVFPRVRRFLMCDTFRPAAPIAPPPIFQLGFELTHAIMGQQIPSMDDWAVLFEESRWRCVGVHPIGIASSAVFDLVPRT